MMNLTDYIEMSKMSKVIPSTLFYYFIYKLFVLRIKLDMLDSQSKAYFQANQRENIASFWTGYQSKERCFHWRNIDICSLNALKDIISLSNFASKVIIYTSLHNTTQY